MPADDKPRDLIIPVKGIYFDQIAAGTKFHEFRLQTPFWTKRLEGRTYRHVVMTRGYPTGGGLEGETRLPRVWADLDRRTNERDVALASGIWIGRRTSLEHGL
jgi:hypothetical protein